MEDTVMEDSVMEDSVMEDSMMKPNTNLLVVVTADLKLSC
jgi:hypothetical protein